MTRHEMRKGPSNPDHAKYRGCKAVSGTMQFGIVTATARPMSKTVSSNLPANQSLCEVLMWPNDQAQRQPPESAGGAQGRAPNHPRLANGKRGGCSLQRS